MAMTDVVAQHDHDHARRNAEAAKRELEAAERAFAARPGSALWPRVERARAALAQAEVLERAAKAAHDEAARRAPIEAPKRDRLREIGHALSVDGIADRMAPTCSKASALVEQLAALLPEVDAELRAQAALRDEARKLAAELGESVDAPSHPLYYDLNLTAPIDKVAVALCSRVLDAARERGFSTSIFRLLPKGLPMAKLTEMQGKKLRSCGVPMTALDALLGAKLVRLVGDDEGDDERDDDEPKKLSRVERDELATKLGPNALVIASMCGVAPRALLEQARKSAP